METVIKNSSPQLLIAGDGSGDFNCDGKDDHVQINKALAAAAKEFGTSVYLKGPFKYTIDNTLLTGSNTILEGDKTAILTIKDNNSWATGKPLIAQINPKEATKGYIKIRGFEIDGNADKNNPDGSRRGDGFHNLMYLYYDDVEISDMYMHDSLGDGLKVKYSNSVKFYNNKVYKLGHDVVFADECQGIDYFNNNVRVMTNSAIRIYNSNGKVYNNEIWTQFEPDAGGPGVQIQYTREKNDPDPMTDIEIHHNNIHDMYGPGIWMWAGGQPYNKEEAKNVYIHDNIFKDCGTHPTYNWLGGIVTAGFYDTLIENNTFDGCYGGGVVYLYPNDSKFSGMAPTGTEKPFVTYVRNNKIFNTRLRKGNMGGIAGNDESKTGQAIINYCPHSAKIISEGNYLWNNKGGNYFNVTSDTDIYHAPDAPEDVPKIVYCLACQGDMWKLTEIKEQIKINCAGCGEEFKR